MKFFSSPSLRVLGLSALSAATLVLAPSSAQAQVACPAQTAAFNVFNPGFQCISGDKLYSNFFAINDPSNTLTNAGQVLFEDFSDEHNVSFQAGFSPIGGSPSTWQVSYTVAILPAFQATKELNSIITSATTSTATPSWTKTLTSNPLTAPPSVVATQASDGGSSLPPGFYSAGVFEADFTSTWEVNTGFLTQVQDTVTQRPIGTSVPGPLPLLGAGAAFLYSRKLRNRIKSAIV